MPVTRMAPCISADVAGRGPIVGDGDDVVHVGVGLPAMDGRTSAATYPVPEDAEVAGGEQDVPEQAEHADLGHLAQIHTGDPGEGQDGHEQLQGITGHHVGGGDRGCVEVAGD